MREATDPPTEGPRPGAANLLPAGPNNQRAVSHGSYAFLTLGPRAQAIAEGLRDVVPAYTDADAPAVQTLGLVLAQLERAAAALDGASRRDLSRLSQDARGWAGTATKLFTELALTPGSRARLGVDLTRLRGAALQEHLADRYGES